MRLLSLALILVVTGCGRSSPENSRAPVAQSATPVTYQCEGGGTIQVSYPSDSTAVVVYEGRTLQMTIAVSGSGSRYVGEGLEWWTKGSGPGSSGTLFRHLSDGTTGEVVEQCEER